MDEPLPETGVVIVVPARLSSQRLPGKALLPLGDSTVLEQVLRRIQAAHTGASIVVAIPDTPGERFLRDWCDERGIATFLGEPNDPFLRILQAARANEADIVVPCSVSQVFLSPRMLWASVRYALDSGMDAVVVARMAAGTACEALPLRTLERLHRMESSLLTRRENLQSGVGAYPERFERALLPPPPRLARADLRFQLDTPDDYRYLQQLYARIVPGPEGVPDLDAAIACVDADPDLCRYAQGDKAVVRAA